MSQWFLSREVRIACENFPANRYAVSWSRLNAAAIRPIRFGVRYCMMTPIRLTAMWSYYRSQATVLRHLTYILDRRPRRYFDKTRSPARPIKGPLSADRRRSSTVIESTTAFGLGRSNQQGAKTLGCHKSLQRKAHPVQPKYPTEFRSLQHRSESLLALVLKLPFDSSSIAA
jgi:hypothetical protein